MELTITPENNVIFTEFMDKLKILVLSYGIYRYLPLKETDIHNSQNVNFLMFIPFT